jgi:TonB family protein
MKKELLILLASMLSSGAVGRPPANATVLEKLMIPAYPRLARLSGIEGTVRVRLKLDPQCNITDISIGDGPPLLVDAVTPAVSSDYVHVHFRACAGENETNIILSYIFSLRGKATNDWSPTYVRVYGDGPSFTIGITTSPPDLAALGLEKSNGKGNGPRTETPQDEDVRLNFSLSYPPLARAAGAQGDVVVAANVDSQCHVTAARALAGHPLLASAVTESVRSWRFPSCANDGREVRITFHFTLYHSDDDVNNVRDDWAPTFVDMASPSEFRIKTASGVGIIYN